MRNYLICAGLLMALGAIAVFGYQISHQRQLGIATLATSDTQNTERTAVNSLIALYNAGSFASTTILADANTWSNAGTTTYSGNVKVAGNLMVSGTFFAPVQIVSSGNATINGALAVTGQTTLAGLSVNSNTVSGERYLTFVLSTTTVWTGTSTVASPFGDSNVVYAPFTGTSATLQCGTNVGTLGVSVGGTYLLASSTANINTFAINLTKGTALNITGGRVSALLGTPTTTTCTLMATGS